MLLEYSDPDSLEAILAFLDDALRQSEEYLEQGDHKVVVAPQEADTTRVDEAKQPQSTIHGARPRAPKKRTPYNRNRAREEQRSELVRLRNEVEDLEFTLKRLQSIKSSHIKHQDHSRTKVDSVWKITCIRQLQQRLRVERENFHLKRSCEKEAQVFEKIQKLLFTRPPLWNMVYPETRIHTKIIEIPVGYMNNMTTLIFEELSANVKKLYRTVGRMEEVTDYRSTRKPLLRNDSGGSRIELFDCTILPFSMNETSEAWWKIWRDYRGTRVHDTTRNVVEESFGLEMCDVKTNTSATFYVQQILHRYVEMNRVVYVWNMYTEPFLFRNNPINGVYYREQSYVVLNPIDEGSMSNCDHGMSTRMLSSEDIHTCFLDPKLKNDAKIAALTKLIAHSMPPYIMARNEAIKSLLLDQALQKRRNK